MIEKYGIAGYEVLDSTAVAIPDSEYERLLDSVKNKGYISADNSKRILNIYCTNISRGICVIFNGWGCVTGR